MLDRMKGEITVFLTLILVLIFSFVGTLLEAARISVARVVSERALLTSMDSAASEYSYPLFKEYHLVLLDLGYDSDQLQEDIAVNHVLDSMEYTFDPTKDLSIFGVSMNQSSMNLLPININEVKMTAKTSITDYNGKLFLHQAVEYTKYKDMTKLVEQLLEKLKLLQSTQVATKVVQEKLKVDEKLLVIDQYKMELMEYIEGIDFNKKGVQVTSNHMVKTNSNFVKKIVMGIPTMTSVGITHSTIFRSLEPSYVNILGEFEFILDTIDEIKNSQKEVDTLKKQQKDLIEKIEQLKKNYNKSQSSKEKVSKKENTKEEGKEEDKNEDTLYLEELNALELELSKVNESLSKLENAIEKLIKNSNEAIDSIKQTSDNVTDTIKSALQVLDKIEKKKDGILSSITDYSQLLKSEESNLEPSLYENLSDDINKSRSYFEAGEDSNGTGANTNFTLMKELLLENKEILTKATLLTKISRSFTEQEMSSLKETISNISKSYSNYHTKDLTFDYSDLVLEDKVKNPITSFFKLISSGIVKLVVDDVSAISDATLKSDSLYSKYANQQSSEEVEEDSQADELSGNIEDSYEEGTNDNILFSLNQYEEENSQLGVLDNTATVLLNKLLFQQYLLRHFKSMKLEEDESTSTKNDTTVNQINNSETATELEVNEENKDSSEEYVKSLPSVLQYEQEYIITGKKKDKDIFSSIIHRILLMRTVLNFVSILGDKGKVEQAQTTALGVVGFTGLPVLIQFTKMLILLVWSYEESLVDTRALLYNKKVPLLKTKETFLVGYEDLMLLNKEFIKKKVDEMDDTKSGRLAFDYDDYMSVFMLFTSDIKKSYRAMDLIEANMNLRYEGGFKMNHCIYGFKMKGIFQIDTLFIQLPFIKNMLEHDLDGVMFELEREYTY